MQQGWFGTRWLAVASALAALQGCGDDASPSTTPEPDAGSERGGSGGEMRTPTGGRAGGSAGSGGASNIDPSAWGCVPEPGDVGGSAPSGEDCCDGLGTCTATTDDASASLPHETCSAGTGLRCVPKSVEDESDAGMGGPTSCRVEFPGAPVGAPSFEGRCLPICFVRYSPIAARLSQSTCANGELCSPCYDPLTGRSTGTCARGGDSPLDPPPPGFVECADGHGYCVPAFAAGSSAGQLAQLTCRAGELCAPKIKVADPAACFERCDAGPLGAGACVPEYLAGAAAAILNSQGCSAGELCAPCDFGTRTGVCD